MFQLTWNKVFSDCCFVRDGSWAPFSFFSSVFICKSELWLKNSVSFPWQLSILRPEQVFSFHYWQKADEVSLLLFWILQGGSGGGCLFAGPCGCWWSWPVLQAGAINPWWHPLVWGFGHYVCTEEVQVAAELWLCNSLRGSRDRDALLLAWAEEMLPCCERGESKNCLQQWLPGMPTGQGQGVCLKVDAS